MSSKIHLGVMLRGKRTLIFDFDGTVADTACLHARAFEDTLAPLGVAVDYPSLAGLKTADAIESCLRVAGRSVRDFDVATLIAEKQRRARQLIASYLRPTPQVEEFLIWARPRFQLCMVTSGSRGTVALALQKLGYQDWFDPVICAEDVPGAKPAPDGFLKALELTQCHPEDAIVFEDSRSGFQAARAAGLTVVDVTTMNWSSATADLSADNWD
jgi:HAD superfamily hydrolase (TIGR01509 family)